MGRKRNLAALRDAQGDAAAVRLERSVEEADEVHGFVVALGEEWVVLHVEDDLRLDGWSAIRLDTIEKVRRARNPTVIERSLEFWEQTVEDPQIDPASVRSVAASAGEAFPLVIVHEEERYPGEVAVGRVLKVTGKRLDLLDVTPGASWDEAPRRFPLQHITRIDAGDHYSVALAHLAGDPPTELGPSYQH